MSQKIIYRQENNKVAIISWTSELTLEDAIKNVPLGRPFLVINSEDLPPREYLKEFFDAIRADFGNPANPNIRVDFEEAKEITRARLRKERVQRFQANDILLRDAVIENDSEKLAQGIAERDRLRNITLLVDTVTTLDELRNLHP